VWCAARGGDKGAAADILPYFSNTYEVGKTLSACAYRDQALSVYSWYVHSCCSFLIAKMMAIVILFGE
jgi:hypothetical protein